MKRILSILLTCSLLVSFVGGAGFVATSCTPEQQPGEQPGTDEPGGEDAPSVPGAPGAFSKFISMISKGENLDIPIQGEWNLFYKGFKAGDGVVGSNKSATTKNVFGTAESPNVIKGGSITLGGTKVTMTAENYLTYALPWGTGASVNANISSNTIWQ